MPTLPDWSAFFEPDIQPRFAAYTDEGYNVVWRTLPEMTADEVVRALEWHQTMAIIANYEGPVHDEERFRQSQTSTLERNARLQEMVRSHLPNHAAEMRTTDAVREFWQNSQE